MAYDTEKTLNVHICLSLLKFNIKITLDIFFQIKACKNILLFRNLFKLKIYLVLRFKLSTYCDHVAV